MRLALILLALMALPAHAERWVLDAGRSTLSFTYTENGVPMQGRFPAFSGWALYDPAAPADSSVFVTVDTEAVELPDFVRTAFARTEDWFATTRHPRAQFELTALVPLGDGGLRAEGVMTVKGRSRTVALPVRLAPAGDCLRATGTLEIALADFDIGRGTVSRLIRVGDTVTVRFDLLGRPEIRAADCG